jgi:hypothetical protein
VIQYRQLVTSKSMDAFQHETRELEIARNAVTVGAELGRGQSGVVFAGSFQRTKKPVLDQDGGDLVPPNTATVAIKTHLVVMANHATSGAVDAIADEALLLEALVLNGLKHRGIVKLLAVVSDCSPVLLCTELMVNGDLSW